MIYGKGAETVCPVLLIQPTKHVCASAAFLREEQSETEEWSSDQPSALYGLFSQVH